MINTTRQESSHENDHHELAKCDAKETERLIDEAATKFARLFYDQCMYAQLQNHKISKKDHNDEL